MSEVKFIPHDEIRLDGNGFQNPRNRFEKGKLRELAEDIAAREEANPGSGLRNPVTLWETEEDGEEIKVLIAGGRRHAAIALLIEEGRAGTLDGRTPYRAFKGDLTAARLEALADNLHREDLTSFEMAAEMDGLVEGGMAQKEIAAKLNKSNPWVSRILTAYRNSSTKLRKAWRSNSLPLDTVMDIAALPEEKQEDAVDEQLEMREGGGRKAAGKARKESKQKLNRVERLSAKDLESLLVIAESAPSDGRYTHGVKDGLRVAAGVLGVGELAKPWNDFLDKMNKEARAKAQAEEDISDENEEFDEDSNE
jgi:ParB/RepB/Spo0J family partition protein